MSLPFVFALAAGLRRDAQAGEANMAKAILLAVLAFTNIIGVIGAGSVAGYFILIPVLLLSVIIFASAGSKVENVAGIGGLSAVLLSSIIIVGFGPTLDNLGTDPFEQSETSRYGIWERSQDIALDHVWVGSGLGTFRRVYVLYEDPDLITSKYVNHAHNDYLQVSIESGIPGLLILSIAILIYLFKAAQLWMTKTNSEVRFKRAATISLMVPLLHSVVDYPLRTPALAVLAAVCLAIVVTPRRSFGRSADTGTENHKRITL
ncbi:MAG: O-antigen ligase family protein [Pseudomonadota bacterium]